METIDANSMSVEALEALLTKKRQEETDRIKKERNEYESYVERNTQGIVQNALNTHKILKEFYLSSVKTLEEMRDTLNRYGMIRNNSKGGYHRITADGKFKVVYKYSTICAWDERAEKAEGLLRDFLSDFVKKRDLKMYNIVSALLERNKEGNLEYSRIQSLYSQEAEFDDPRWKEAIRLFKESFHPVDSKMYVEVYQRSEKSQKWELVILNLSSF